MGGIDKLNDTDQIGSISHPDTNAGDQSASSRPEESTLSEPEIHDPSDMAAKTHLGGPSAPEMGIDPEMPSDPQDPASPPVQVDEYSSEQMVSTSDAIPSADAPKEIQLSVKKGLAKTVGVPLVASWSKPVARELLVSAIRASSRQSPPSSSMPTPSPGEGGGSGNDGDGNDNRDPKNIGESVEHAFDVLSPAVAHAVDRLGEHGMHVKEIPLADNVGVQRQFRMKYLELSKDEIKAVQDSESTRHADNPLAWYRLNKYRGGRITMDNAVRILGYNDARDVLYRGGDFSCPADILELGPGNGDLIRGFYKAKWRLGGYLDSARMVRQHGRRATRSLNGQIEERTKGAMLTLDDDDIDAHLKTIDFVPAFSTRLLQSNICAITANAASKPEELFKPKRLQTGHIVQLEPNSQDIIMTNLLLDRVNDIIQLIENIRLLSKFDKSTRFMIGAIFPFSSHSDSESPSVNIPSIKFWNEQGDIRSRWALPDRTESIVNAVFDLNRLGLITERISELPMYEVYSPHNLIEKAGDLRTKYRYLVENLQYQDPELQGLVQNVLNGAIPDNELVAFPQSYDHKIVMLSGHALPKDGSRFRSSPTSDRDAGTDEKSRSNVDDSSKGSPHDESQLDSNQNPSQKIRVA